jgi:hypothetical protein
MLMLTDLTLQQASTEGGATFNAAELNTTFLSGVTQLNFTLFGLVTGCMSPQVLDCKSHGSQKTMSQVSWSCSSAAQKQHMLQAAAVLC